MGGEKRKKKKRIKFHFVFGPVFRSLSFCRSSRGLRQREKKKGKKEGREEEREVGGKERDNSMDVLSRRMVLVMAMPKVPREKGEKENKKRGRGKRESLTSRCGTVRLSQHPQLFLVGQHSPSWQPSRENGGKKKGGKKKKKGRKEESRPLC